RSRPASRTETSVMESMRGCHRSRRQTQPVCGAFFCATPLAKWQFQAPLTVPVRRLGVSLPFALAQLVQKMLQVRGRANRLGAGGPLQPIPDGVADRAAGLAVYRVDDIGDEAVHGRFRWRIRGDRMTPYQVTAAELVSGRQPVAWPFGKNAMNTLCP